MGAEAAQSGERGGAWKTGKGICGLALATDVLCIVCTVVICTWI